VDREVMEIGLDADQLFGVSALAFALLPLTLLIAARIVLPSRLVVHTWVRWMVGVVFSGIVLRYLWWRTTVTVLPADDLSAQSIFVWSVFAIEILAWVDTAILLLMLLRQTDRRAEASMHEARLRRMHSADLPTVDVFIATYNESLEVLEKSTTGAAELDWPTAKLRVWLLDDGRRDWLRDYAAEKGLGYLRRDDNSHAKAGNINAALKRTDGEFVLVLDADFVPQNWFLYRTIGFFDNPKIGIVQTPHHFFNHDPMQSALGLRRRLPDEQRMFFDVIMPGRDGWDCAFCCGSNGVIRRAALETAGGGLPTSSITEDILLTMVMLRHGFITRYLGERLAVGLAPESLEAYFVQRARWAQGAIQAIYLREGPLGPGLRPIHRLTFLPLHWISQSLVYTVAMLAPPIYLLTGLAPLMNASTTTVLHYQIPAVVGAVMVMQLFAKSSFVPLAQAAHAVLQAFRLLPVVLGTLMKPRGHVFKVTPKGADAQGHMLDWPTLTVALGIIALTILGLALNANPGTRIILAEEMILFVAFWSVVNIVVLAVVATIVVAPQVRRSEERFQIDLPCRVHDPRGIQQPARTLDLSMTGSFLLGGPVGVRPGDWVVVDLLEVGRIAGRATRVGQTRDGEQTLGVSFDLPQGPTRDALIRLLYTQGLDNSAQIKGDLTLAILARVVKPDMTWTPSAALSEAPPIWASTLLATKPVYAPVTDLRGGRGISDH
jgi:cellulose synthase (UDP-forming)